MPSKQNRGFPRNLYICSVYMLSFEFMFILQLFIEKNSVNGNKVLMPRSITCHQYFFSFFLFSILIGTGQISNRGPGQIECLFRISFLNITQLTLALSRRNSSSLICALFSNKCKFFVLVWMCYKHFDSYVNPTLDWNELFINHCKLLNI